VRAAPIIAALLVSGLAAGVTVSAQRTRQDPTRQLYAIHDEVGPPYHAHAGRLPLSLQDHGHPVRDRNIWTRDLET
jgi:hypothetical protein